MRILWQYRSMRLEVWHTYSTKRQFYYCVFVSIKLMYAISLVRNPSRYDHDYTMQSVKLNKIEYIVQKPYRTIWKIPIKKIFIDKLCAQSILCRTTNNPFSSWACPWNLVDWNGTRIILFQHFFIGSYARSFVVPHLQFQLAHVVELAKKLTCPMTPWCNYDLYCIVQLRPQHAEEEIFVYSGVALGPYFS